MKRKIIMMISITVVIVLMSINPVIATEIITGSEAASCPFQINVRDETGGLFTGNIQVELKDIAAGKQYSFSLTKESGYTVSGSIIANTTYTLSFSYPDSGLYVLSNGDSSSIANRFGATGSGYVCNWVIRKADGTGRQVEVKTGNTEADTLFKEFYDAVKHIEGNSKWSDFLKPYRLFDEYGRDYVTHCNSTVESWNSKTEFEKFLWYETYIRVVVSSFYGDYDRYFGSEENFLNNTLFASHGLTFFGNGTEQKAYEKLMKWQYKYIKEHGVAYNFMTGLNYLESQSGVVNTTPNPDDLENQSQDDAVTEEKGIWDKTINSLKSNIVTIIILLITSGILAGVIIYRRKKTVDNDIK